MNRKSFLSAILMAIAAPFLPSLPPERPFGKLIGEGTGTTGSNPEVIAPLDQLKKMLDKAGNLNVKVTGRLRGKDMIIDRRNKGQAIEIKGSVPLEYFKVNKHPANQLGYNQYKIKRNRLN